jgi:hypothetical protein
MARFTAPSVINGKTSGDLTAPPFAAGRAVREARSQSPWSSAGLTRDYRGLPQLSRNLLQIVTHRRLRHGQARLMAEPTGIVSRKPA